VKKSNALLGLAITLVLISLAAWGYQMQNGLSVTNMRNSFSWGLYIATFAFFVGVAAGGLIVSSSVYLFNLEKLEPFTRIASLSAFASILGAGAMILPDMGRVERVWKIFIHPNFSSPLVWDVVVIAAYLVITFLSVYVQLLPDWRKEGRGFFNGWTKSLSQEEVEALSKKWSKGVAGHLDSHCDGFDLCHTELTRVVEYSSVAAGLCFCGSRLRNRSSPGNFSARRGKRKVLSA